MMIKTGMKHILCGLLVLAISGVLMVQTAYAGPQAEVILSQNGSNVDVTIEKTATDVSAISLDLNLDIKSDNDDALAIRFDFSDAVEKSTNIHDYRIETLNDGEKMLTIYMAGGNDLLKDGSLFVGQIVLDLDTSRSAGAEVSITIPAGETAFKAINNGYTQNVEDLYLSDGTFVALLGSSQVLPTDPEQNNALVGGLPATGDEGVIIVSVLLILVAGVLTAFGINRWRKSHSEA